MFNWFALGQYFLEQGIEFFPSGSFNQVILEIVEYQADQSVESLALQSITSNVPYLTEKVHDLDELLSRVTLDNLHREIMLLP